ncbi:MAG: ABC transporter ATP-binding protein [Sulfuricella sp.]|nr:ABC transporter ATP-binding protein [Sulfuricella sp.]
MVLLEVKGLTYSVRDKKPLSGLDLTVHEQEIHALLGANGAGKTTFANLVMGCGGYMPTAGEIRFQGQLINTLAIHERAQLGITMAWQEPARFEGLSVADYLSLGRAANAPADCLRRVGLEPGLYLGRALDKTLSGGERKRIELASLLALKPKLAILDEPDSGIDMLSLQVVVDVIKELQREGAAVLLITHRQEIARIANRASLLCGGRLVLTGEPERVAEHFRHRDFGVCDGETCHA